MKKRIMLLVVLTITIGASGCMFMKTKDNINDMVTHMNEKYDDYFTYKEPFGGGNGAKSIQIIVSSTKIPDQDIWVEYQQKDGVEIYADNYVYVKYANETTELIEEILTRATGCDVIVSYGVGLSGNVNSFTNETTLIEFISSNESNIGFVAVVSKEFTLDKATLEENLRKEFASTKMIVDIGQIYFAQNDEQFSNPSVLPNKVLNNMTRLLFKTENGGVLGTLEWSWR